MQKLAIFSLACIFVSVFGIPQTASSQHIELLASNTVNGAATGLGLGAATLGLQNSSAYEAPLRIGLGLGTLYGIGVGVYDITKAEKGSEYYVSATFNDGKNSSVIVLLDTFYGAAAGAVVASAVTLILNEPLKYGLQYGASAGAWAGFGFGLIDAFLLAKEPDEIIISANNISRASGLLSLQTGNRHIDVGLVNPSLTKIMQLDSHTLSQSASFKVDLLNVSVSL